MIRLRRSDVVAIAVMVTVILAGWGVRYVSHHRNAPSEVTVIRGAIPLPAELDSSAIGISGYPGLGALINLNTADVAELERLPMIGPARAAAIVENRTQYGPFATIWDITRVTGIGPAILDQIRPLVTVGADGADQPPVAPR